LIDISIFSFSKRKESSFEAAAVYVISSEDIRLSGAQNIYSADLDL
jgi:hypothetical protein